MSLFSLSISLPNPHNYIYQKSVKNTIKSLTFFQKNTLSPVFFIVFCYVYK